MPTWVFPKPVFEEPLLAPQRTPRQVPEKPCALVWAIVWGQLLKFRAAVPHICGWHDHEVKLNVNALVAGKVGQHRRRMATCRDTPK